MNIQQKSQQNDKIDIVIVGLGTTGLSVARYLSNENCEFAVVDSRQTPPCADDLFALSDHNVTHYFGDFCTDLLSDAKQLVVNPGIAASTSEIASAKEAGVEIVGDVELFFRELKQRGASEPIISITGSNGKTTVTTLLDLMAKESDVNVGTGGNIGTPVLDLLTPSSQNSVSANKDKELFILELSSYQLETTPSLKSSAAVILNVSEDHLDRYDNSIEKYAESKSVIYKNCEHIVFNREDDYSTQFALRVSGSNLLSFGLDMPQIGQFGIQTQNSIEWLAKGEELLMQVKDVKQVGRHNLANSLAALALGEAVGLKMSAMLKVLSEFEGMEHRTQWVKKLNKVSFYNDSKGTNVGATISALSGLSNKTVLIVGGEGKGADFLPLKEVISTKARAVVLIGKDADKISAVIDDSIIQVFAINMSDAVEKAYDLANKDEADNVLLSPACASFDMFDNYIQRGLAFIDAVDHLECKLKNTALIDEVPDA